MTAPGTSATAVIANSGLLTTLGGHCGLTTEVLQHSLDVMQVSFRVGSTR